MEVPMMRFGRALLSFAKIVVGSVILMLIMNPAKYASEAQQAIISEYDGLYCSPVAEARKNPLQHLGAAEVMSRVVVKSHLGNLALAEYAKCKIIGGS